MRITRALMILSVTAGVLAVLRVPTAFSLLLVFSVLAHSNIRYRYRRGYETAGAVLYSQATLTLTTVLLLQEVTRIITDSTLDMMESVLRIVVVLFLSASSVLVLVSTHEDTVKNGEEGV